MNNLLIFIGAGLGGVSRYWVSNFIHFFVNKDFPYGTLIVNISGSLVMGFLFVLLLERFNQFSIPLRSFLLIGFLGGYTTFSSFSIETINLIETGSWIPATLNILASVIFCLIAAWLGTLIGRQ